MEVFYDEQVANKIIETIKSKDGDRPEGVHVSDLLYCLNKSFFKHQNGEAELDLSTLLLFTQGRAIQDFLTGESGDAPPIQVDGIWMTMDFIPDDKGLPPIEVKMTYMSSTRKASTGWLQQMMAYCKGLGVNEYSLVRYCLEGNYKRVNDQLTRPTLLPMRYVFTDEEIEENWAWLVDRKGVLEKAYETNTMPLILIPDYMGKDGGKWQCTRCSWKEECPCVG